MAPILPLEVPSDAKIWRFLRAYQYDPELAAQRLRRQVRPTERERERERALPHSCHDTLVCCTD